MIKKGLQPLGVLAFLTISVIFLYVLLFRSLARSHAPASRKEHMRPNSTRHLRGPLPTGRALTRRQAVLCCDRPRSLFLPGQLSSFIHCNITPCYCAARELFTKAEARLLNRPSPNKLLFECRLQQNSRGKRKPSRSKPLTGSFNCCSGQKYSRPNRGGIMPPLCGSKQVSRRSPGLVLLGDCSQTSLYESSSVFAGLTSASSSVAMEMVDAAPQPGQRLTSI